MRFLKNISLSIILERNDIILVRCAQEFQFGQFFYYFSSVALLRNLYSFILEFQHPFYHPMNPEKNGKMIKFCSNCFSLNVFRLFGFFVLLESDYFSNTRV